MKRYLNERTVIEAEENIYGYAIHQNPNINQIKKFDSYRGYESCRGLLLKNNNKIAFIFDADLLHDDALKVFNQTV